MNSIKEYKKIELIVALLFAIYLFLVLFVIVPLLQFWLRIFVIVGNCFVSYYIGVWLRKKKREVLNRE